MGDREQLDLHVALRVHVVGSATSHRASSFLEESGSCQLAMVSVDERRRWREGLAPTVERGDNIANVSRTFVWMKNERNLLMNSKTNYEDCKAEVISLHRPSHKRVAERLRPEDC